MVNWLTIFRMDQTQSSTVQQNNNDSQVENHPETQSRLQQLQNMLNIVNTSLVSNAADFLPDLLLSDEGRIQLNRSNMIGINSSAQIDFSNFKVCV